MGYIQQSLSHDEEVKELFTLHWFAKVPVFLWALLGMFFSIFVFGARASPGLSVVFGLLSLISFYKAVSQFIYIISVEQGVTSRRVILKTGLISRNTEEMKLTSIETVEIRQSILGRIFGFGKVKITGRGISDVVYPMIDNPMQVKKAIEGAESVAEAIPA